MPLSSFGAELIDVTEGPTPAVRDGTPTGMSNVARFQAIITRALASGTNTVQDKILYVPPGEYRIENEIPSEWSVNLWDAKDSIPISWRDDRINNPFGASLIFPAKLTLWMAPGAVFVLDAGCILHIASSLVCEATRIFNLSDVEGQETDRLVVFGERTPKVLPEWWGAGPGRDSSRAIQHAIDAAIHNRANQWEMPNGGPPYTYHQWFVTYPSIPIELRGEYSLGRPIKVQGGKVTTPLLRLIGERGVRETPNLDVFLLPSPRDTGPTVDVALSIYDRTLRVERVEGSTDPDAPSVVPVNPGPGDPTGPRLRVQAGPLLGQFVYIVTLNRGAPLTFRVVIDPLIRARREVFLFPTTTIGGVWQGREAQGARLIASAAFEGSALLRFVDTTGLTLRNVAFDVNATDASACLEITTPVYSAIDMQGMAVRRCRFEGRGATLVQVGPVAELISEGDVTSGHSPLARLSNAGLDASGLIFDDCTFRTGVGGVGAMVRALNAVPLGFRNCSFSGPAKTMLWLWEATVLVDGCSFDNPGYTRPPGPYFPSLEPPDGADIFISFEPPLDFGEDGRLRTLGTPLPGCTTTACRSRSTRFLSTASNARSTRSVHVTLFDIVQFTQWPVVLLNTRHLPGTVEPDPAAIRWGLQPIHPQAVIESMESRVNGRMGPQAPLVVIGGQYQGSLRVSYGAPSCAFVGPRDLSGGLMPVDLVVEERTREGRGVVGWSEVFCLPVDQRYSL